MHLGVDSDVDLESRFEQVIFMSEIGGSER